MKVGGDFTLSSPTQSVVDERPNDTVKTISKPYLAWSIARPRLSPAFEATSGDTSS
jgi:hypothetical protein